MRTIFAVLASCMMVSCSPAPNGGGNRAEPVADDTGPQRLATVPLVIRHGELAPDRLLAIEIALTPQQQEKGLMHRTDLRAGEGMLFPMVPARMPSFWMKDTPLSLDLIFIRTDGGIARILSGAKPNDPTPLFAEVPVAGVLELRGGEAKRLALDEGDKISWGECTQEPQAPPVVTPENFCPA